MHVPFNVCLVTLTPSAFSSVLASISWRALTDSDCSNTKVQMDRSGGTFWDNRSTSEMMDWSSPLHDNQFYMEHTVKIFSLKYGYIR